MSGMSDRLHRSLTDLEQVLAKKQVGRADATTHVRLVDLAAKNIEERLPDRSPSLHSVVSGGTRSERELEDRDDEARITRRLLEDSRRLPKITREIERLSRELYFLVVRNTQTVSRPEELPADTEGLPGCVSCARPQNPRLAGSGHFAPVALPDPHAAKRWGEQIAESLDALALCSFCRRHAAAEAKKRGAAEVTPVHFPPLKAVDELNRVSEQAAGRWLAKQEQGAA